LGGLGLRIWHGSAARWEMLGWLAGHLRAEGSELIADTFE